MSDYPTPGKNFAGRYLIIRNLGRGGMGSVFLADDKRLPRKVALKLLLHDDTQILKRFELEARATYELIGHPNIVKIFDIDPENDPPFICMEYVPGESLQTILTDLAREGKDGLPVEDCISLARGVAEGLAHAHRFGIVHRDIKPGNILLEDCEPSRPKIIDFGVVAIPNSKESLTQTGETFFTPKYASPEQFNEVPWKHLDGRTDLYSLGCVLFEMLAGHPLFEGSRNELKEKHLHTTVRFPQNTLQKINGYPGLENLVYELLEKKPTERPPDATAVVARLGSILASYQANGQRNRAEVASPHNAEDEEVAKRGAEKQADDKKLRRFRLLKIAGSVVFVGLGAFLTYELAPIGRTKWNSPSPRSASVPQPRTEALSPQQPNQKVATTPLGNTVHPASEGKSAETASRYAVQSKRSPVLSQGLPAVSPPVAGPTTTSQPVIPSAEKQEIGPLSSSASNSASASAPPPTTPSDITKPERNCGAHNSGTLIWTGTLKTRDMLTIEGQNHPSTGSLEGTRFPDCPFKVVSIVPPDVSITRYPEQSNRWRLILENKKNNSIEKIEIGWQLDLETSPHP
jgi:serine/threonine protein kinase